MNKPFGGKLVRKRKIAVMVVAVLVGIGCYAYFASDWYHEKQVKEANEFVEMLNNSGFHEEVRNRLEQNGYEETAVMGSIYSKDRIDIEVHLSEESNQETTKGIEKIIKDVGNAFDVDPDSFNIKVTEK